MAYEKIVGAVRRRTISALIYPAILVMMMIVLVGIIVVKVVPSFSEFYANFGRQLPLQTRIGITDALLSVLLLSSMFAAPAARSCERKIPTTTR